jgi:CubicO group peptidase (beta-lactamase class C family)
MFRSTTATVLGAFTLLAASAGVPSAAPDDDLEPQADAVKLAASIQSQLTGRAFGWQFAVSQDGKFVQASTAGTSGFALSTADAGGSPVAMTPTTKMDIASATKTVTAIATMKLLRANDLTIESRVAPYLPASWKRGAGFEKAGSGRPQPKPIRFRHLLAHTSGINQAIAAGGVSIPNGWEGSQTIVKNGGKADSSRVYHNHNYGLLRVLNAELYKRSAGKPTVTQANHAVYALEHMQKGIFEPAGLKGITCAPADPVTAMKSYPVGATQTSKGTLHMGGPESCAGHRGLFMSAFQHVQLLAHLRHGEIIEPEDLDEMDELRLGWNQNADKGANEGAFWHGGDLLGSNQLHTCGATFDDGTEVSIMVNSPIAGQSTGDLSDKPAPPASPCGVALAAWKAAK